MSKNILVSVAWPYASGSRHLGHIGGAYLPADIFARYNRMIGNNVIMVSGSDVHGTPITVRADDEGVEPIEIVNRYHAEFLSYWEKLNIQWDNYTTTMTDNHKEVTQEMFLKIKENGFIEKNKSIQAQKKISFYQIDMLKVNAQNVITLKLEVINVTVVE